MSCRCALLIFSLLHLNLRGMAPLGAGVVPKVTIPVTRWRPGNGAVTESRKHSSFPDRRETVRALQMSSDGGLPQHSGTHGCRIAGNGATCSTTPSVMAAPVQASLSQIIGSIRKAQPKISKVAWHPSEKSEVPGGLIYHGICGRANSQHRRLRLRSLFGRALCQ